MVTRFYSFFVVFLTISAFSAAVRADALSDSLIYHSYFGNAGEVQRLLDKGADPNAKDKHGWTALAIASDRSDSQATPIALALLAKGADVNAAVERNYPIINAIVNKNASLVAALMSHKLNLVVTDAKGNSPLVLARKMQQPDIIYYLEKKAFEDGQLRAYLYSAEHLRQITDKFVMANCQYQYWSFYLKSEQDNNMDKAALTKRIQENATIVGAMSAEGSLYFQTFKDGTANRLAASIRDNVFQQLNAMISNRNRRENGVGKESDMLKRCEKIRASISK